MSAHLPRSLRGRLLLVLIGLAALPSLAIGGFAYQNGRQTIESRVRAQLVSIADLKRDQLTDWLDNRISDARLLGENFLNEEHFTEILNRRVNPARRSAFAGFLTDNLRSLQASRHGYDEILFVDAAGRIVLSTNQAHIGASLRTDPGVIGTLQSPAGAFIQDIHRRGSDGMMEMVFGHVLHAVDLASSRVLPAVNGAVIIRVRMADTVYPLLDAWPGRGASSEVVLVRRQRDRAEVLSPLRFMPSAPLHVEMPLAPLGARSGRSSAQGWEGIGASTDYRGVPVLMVYRLIPRTGWEAVVKMDVTEAFAPVAAFTRGAALMTLLILLAAAGAGVLLAGALTRPLGQLVNATRSVAAGHFNGEISAGRTDEIGALADAFRSMVSAIRERDAGLRQGHAELGRAYDTTLEGWSRALDLRDKETEGHTQRVAELTVRLARAIGVAEPDLVHLRRGALLHDIGKMGIPDRILYKPGPLTDQEWEIMRRHPAYAYELLSPIPYLRPALDIPYCHHEKWDGTGYPRGLRGEAIPLAARIFAVADVYDALRSDRPYRPAWSEQRVRDHIRRQAGAHFDPRMVEAFLRLISDTAPLSVAATPSHT